MKRLIKFGLVGLVGLGAIAISGEISAQTVPAISVQEVLSPTGGNSTYKATIFGTPRTQVPITLSGAGTTVSKSFRANGCGFVTIPNAANYSGLTVNGQAVGVTSVLAKTAIATPTCQGTVSSTLPATHDTGGAGSNSFNVGDGSIMVNVNAVSTAPNGRTVDASYADNSEKSRFVTLNGCGLGKVSNISPNASISVDGGSTVAINSISSIAGLRCTGDKVAGSETDFTFANSLPSVFKDSQNSIYFKTTANSTVSVGLASVPSTKSVTSDRCGGLTIGSQLRPQTEPFTLNGVTIDPSTLSTALKPNCKSTAGVYAYDVMPSGNFKTSAGQVFIKNNATYPNGFGDRRILQISTSGSVTRNLKANACGLATIKSTTSNPITGSTAFTYNDSSYDVDGLPLDGGSCINAGTSAAPDYKLYRALN